MTRGFCSSPGHQDREARLYPRGWCCETCAPGPEPPGRYCLAVCYCGRCPHRRAVPLVPIVPNVIDFRAVASGKRRARLGEYREAQAQVQQSRPSATTRQGENQ